MLGSDLFSENGSENSAYYLRLVVRMRLEYTRYTHYLIKTKLDRVLLLFSYFHCNHQIVAVRGRVTETFFHSNFHR